MMGEEKIGPWIQTASGRKFDLLRPTADQVALSDIAHALARIARFNGHSLGPIPWNVADHSLLVERLLPAGSDPSLRLAALLHDAHEAYLADFTSPLKAALNSVTKDNAFSRALWIIEHGIQAAIHFTLGLKPLPGQWIEIIKTADLQALRLEAEQLMAPPPEPWIELPEAPAILLTPHPPEVADHQFMTRALALFEERHGFPLPGIRGAAGRKEA